jgi:hypothetical protein
MEFAIFCAIAAAIWAYLDFRQKQNKATAIAACREELINAFPGHASQLSDGIAAIILADGYEKKGCAQKFRAAQKKFRKQSDYTKPTDQRSEKTNRLGIAMLIAAFDYYELAISRLPESLRAELKSIPAESRHDVISDALTRTWARVN